MVEIWFWKVCRGVFRGLVVLFLVLVGFVFFGCFWVVWLWCVWVCFVGNDDVRFMLRERVGWLLLFDLVMFENVGVYCWKWWCRFENDKGGYWLFLLFLVEFMWWVIVVLCLGFGGSCFVWFGLFWFGSIVLWIYWWWFLLLVRVVVLFFGWFSLGLWVVWLYDELFGLWLYW